MKLRRRLLLALLAAIVMAVAGAPEAAAAGRVWEHISAAAPAPAADADSGDVALDVSVRDGYLYVTLSRRSPVKLFTILGQTVSQTELPAGTSRLRIPARGIYILRAGDATVRITV